MKKLVFGAAIAAAMFTASAAQAATFTYNFCGNPDIAGESDTCPADLSEASLTFVSIDGTADVNDYTLTVRFVGTDPALYIDSFDVQAPFDINPKPGLTSTAGSALGDWSVYYNKIDDGQGCTEDKNNHKFVCVISDGNDALPATNPLGASFAGTNDWVFTVNFDGDLTLTSTSNVNLRANFSDAQGNTQGQGIPGNLSPSGKYVFDTTGPQDTSGPVDTIGGPGNVPEPALLSLLGLGLVGAAARLRKRS
jgi:hypothetical protein